MLQSLPDLLTWRKTSSVPVRLRGRYEEYLERRVRRLAAQNEEVDCVLESLELLSRERRRAFLRAPQVASRLVACATPARFDVRPVAKSLLAELAAAGIPVDLAGPTWTVLGDRCLDPRAKKTLRRAPAIPGTSIAIDSGGPMDFSNVVTGPLVLPSEKERLAVERTLGKAARLVAAASPAAFQFWNTCIDVVAIRAAKRASMRLSSSSFARNPRLMLLLYGHLDKHEAVWVANAIVHEAIHSLLLMHEEIEGPFVPRTTGVARIKVRSAWSGNDLFFSNYVHALIVWYGLYWFWAAAEDAGAAAARPCAAMKERARAGFDHRPFSNLPREVRRHLAPSTAGLLGRIERRMRSL